MSRPVALLMCEDHPKWAHYPGLCADMLGGRTLEVYRCYADEFPDPSAHDDFLVSGSRHGVEEWTPWMRKLAAMLRDDLASRPEVRVVALCFGCQLVAKAFGGAVGRLPSFRLGVEHVRIVSSPSLPHFALGEVHCLATSHGDEVTRLPPGATLLASSRTSENEIFLVGRNHNVLCVQCHPELRGVDLTDHIAPARRDVLLREQAEVVCAHGCVDLAAPPPGYADVVQEDVGQIDAGRMRAALRDFMSVRESGLLPSSLPNDAITMLSYTSYVAHLVFYTSALQDGGTADAVGIVAATSMMVLVYMADRMILQEEDRNADHPQLRSARGGRRHLFALGFALAYLWCVTQRPFVLVHTVLASEVCVWYAVPLPWVRRRIKNLFPLSKNLFVGAMHTYWAFAVATTHRPNGWHDAALLACATFGATMSTAFMDIKDVEGDVRAGVVTVPTLLGPWRALRCFAATYAAAAAGCLTLAADWASTLAIVYALHALGMCVLARRRAVPGLDVVCASWGLPLIVHSLLSVG